MEGGGEAREGLRKDAALRLHATPQEMRGVRERSERRSFLLNPVSSAPEIRPLCSLEEGGRRRERERESERHAPASKSPHAQSAERAAQKWGEGVGVRIEQAAEKHGARGSKQAEPHLTIA